MNVTPYDKTICMCFFFLTVNDSVITVFVGLYKLFPVVLFSAPWWSIVQLRLSFKQEGDTHTFCMQRDLIADIFFLSLFLFPLILSFYYPEPFHCLEESSLIPLLFYSSGTLCFVDCRPYITFI